MPNPETMRGKYRIDGQNMTLFELIQDGKNAKEWLCKKCGLLRSNKSTHTHGIKL